MESVTVRIRGCWELISTYVERQRTRCHVFTMLKFVYVLATMTSVGWMYVSTAFDRTLLETAVLSISWGTMASVVIWTNRYMRCAGVLFCLDMLSANGTILILSMICSQATIARMEIFVTRLQWFQSETTVKELGFRKDYEKMISCLHVVDILTQHAIVVPFIFLYCHELVYVRIHLKLMGESVTNQPKSLFKRSFMWAQKISNILKTAFVGCMLGIVLCVFALDNMLGTVVDVSEPTYVLTKYFSSNYCLLGIFTAQLVWFYNWVSYRKIVQCKERVIENYFPEILGDALDKAMFRRFKIEKAKSEATIKRAQNELFTLKKQLALQKIKGGSIASDQAYGGENRTAVGNEIELKTFNEVMKTCNVEEIDANNSRVDLFEFVDESAVKVEVHHVDSNV